MSPNKTLYVRDDDLPLWERAEAHAQATRRSLSQLVTDALAAAVPAAMNDDDLEDIEIYASGATRRFRGRWLVDPDRDNHGYAGYDLGAYWGIALTAKGQFAVYTAHCNDGWEPTLSVHPALREAVANLPETVAARAAEALGQEYVIDMDI